jgi:TPR repeat protein
MGHIYEDGIGIPTNLAEAVKWHEMSAEQWNPAAELSLGGLCANGKGVKRDLVKAYIWVAIAGPGEHPDALSYLQSLTANMTNNQISNVQALAMNRMQEHLRDPERNLNHIIYKPQ